MGTWGPNAFENDEACDWAYEFEDCDDLSIIEAALDSALSQGDGYLDSGAGAIGIAACEAVARVRGKFGVRDAYTEPLDQWVETHPGLDVAHLVPLTLKVIERIVGEHSELQELWAESESGEEWLSAVEDLRSRLS